jgi:serine/threonine protein phosphatase PrpC
MGEHMTALFLQHSEASIGHIGDSRAYKISDGRLFNLRRIIPLSRNGNAKAG